MQLVGVLEEAARDLVVSRVEAKSQVGGKHGRLVLLVGVVSVGNDEVVGLRLPLGRASRALHLLPVVLVDVLEVVVTCSLLVYRGY